LRAVFVLGAESFNAVLHGLREEIGIVQVGFFAPQSCFCFGDLVLGTEDSLFRALDILLDRARS
jgi:hypothetical protein